MISFKLERKDGTFPVFVGPDVLARTAELLELYRFTGPLLLLVRRKHAEMLRMQSGLFAKKGRFLELSDTAALWDLRVRSRIWDRLPWTDIHKQRGAVLFAFGDERVLAFAAAVGANWKFPPRLILSPADAWSFLTGATARLAEFAWQQHAGLFRVPVRPQMVLVQAADWERRREMRLLWLAGLFRAYFMAPAEQFTQFGERWFKVALSGDPAPAGWIQDFLHDRQQLLRRDTLPPEWEAEFGLKIVRAIEVEQRRRIPDLLRALLVWFELMWSWEMAAELMIAADELAESMTNLIRRVLVQHKIKPEKWEQIRAAVLAKLSPVLTGEVWLPRELGRLQRLSVVDKKAALRMVKRCAL